MGLNNYTGFFDYYPLRNIVNKKYDDLLAERKKFADDVTKKINDKIELSNEDHCGSCGQYAITKNESNQKNISYNGYISFSFGR